MKASSFSARSHRVDSALHRRRSRLPAWVSALAVASGLSVSSASANVVLNEIMASNQGAVENGVDNPDYVELYNTSGQTIDLSNHSLTDDPAVPRTFVFPNGTSLAAGARLIVWCDLNTGSPGLHTGFGLGATSDRLQLYAADGATVLDEVVFGMQVPNLPIGRIPDGSGAWTLNQATPLAANTTAEFATSGALRINEWMARPATGEDWIEVFNTDNFPVQVSGFVLTDATGNNPGNRAIPALSYIAPRGFVQFFASDLQKQDADHLDFKLSADGETLTLYSTDRSTIIDRVNFGAQANNISQGRVPDGGDTIASFSGLSITPGKPNAAEIASVVINEVLSHTDPPLEDAIELYNPTASAVDISHWWLSDSISKPKKYRIAPGTIIQPGGYAVFYEYQLSFGADGFSLNSYEGDEAVLSAGDASGNLTGQQVIATFGALMNGVSIGRHATSVGVDFVPMTSPTFGVSNPGSLPQFRQGTGATNSSVRISPVVINEIFYQPPASNLDDEYIEFHNPTANAVRLFDVEYPTNTWRLRDGITFNFPFNIQVPAGSYFLLVNFDPQITAQLSAFRTRYSVPSEVPIFGPFTGKLSDTGETIEWQHPDHPEGLDSPDAGFVPYEIQERIKYSAATPWPTGANGTGQSLQRHNALTYGNEPTNWFAANPTAGRSNTATADPDADNDGMLDEWETANGLNPENPADATTDLDNDGASNLAEFLAGTNPGSNTSLFNIASLQRAGAEWQLTFSGVAGKAYAVQTRASLSEGTWQTVANVPTVSSTGVQTVNLPADTALTRFVRIVLATE